MDTELHKSIRKLVRWGVIKPKQGEELLRLPCVELPPFTYRDNDTKNRVIFENSELSERFRQLDEFFKSNQYSSSRTDLYPFDEFIVFPKGGYGPLHIMKEDDGSFTGTVLYDANKLKNSQDSLVSMQRPVTKGSRLSFSPMKGSTVSKMKGFADRTVSDKDKKSNDYVRFLALSVYGVDFILALEAMLEFAEDHSLYPVLKEPAEKKTGSKKKNRYNNLPKATGPRVLYLDSLATSVEPTTLEPVKVSKGERQPTLRRAHRRTLRADRYKHHPMYMVEKGVPVKQAWVGDKDKIINGNRYTLKL